MLREILGNTSVSRRQGESNSTLGAGHERHDGDKVLRITSSVCVVISVEGNVVLTLRNKLIKIHLFLLHTE